MVTEIAGSAMAALRLLSTAGLPVAGRRYIKADTAKVAEQFRQLVPIR